MEHHFEQWNHIVDLIENSLQGELDIAALAKEAKVSVYEFRRIFSFLAGIPLGEYIKNRRLSVAAEELVREKPALSELAERYGYSSASSFSRAFKEFHGCPPNEISHHPIRMFTGLSFDFSASGAETIEYAIVSEEAFFVDGVCMLSDLSDSECCEAVWEAFEQSRLSDRFGEGEPIYAVYENTENGVRCTIGRKNDQTGTFVKPSLWAVFKQNRTDDRSVNEFYHQVQDRWFGSGPYRRREGMPNMEVFPPDMSRDGFEWKICLPIE